MGELPERINSGVGSAELVGDVSIQSHLQLQLEYQFKDDWADKDVKDFFPDKSLISPKKAKKAILLSTTPVKMAETAPSAAITDALAVNASLDDSKKVTILDGTPYLSTLERVEQAIRKRDYESVRDCFTKEGYEIFDKLVHYGNATVLQKPQYIFFQFSNYALARSMLMRFQFKNNHKAFTENITFCIVKDPSSADDGKISSLAFSLADDVTNAVMTKDRWTEHAKTAIINFIENYQTAYALEREDYLDAIFSDNALIIVGRVVKPQGDSRLPLSPTVESKRYTKKEYLANLKKNFASKVFINLKMSNISIKRSPGDTELYGIQLKQEYCSSGYDDTGYLFLVVDLNRPMEPMIHVRTWQPLPDENFGLYDLTNIFSDM
jgi:hypothetical protein